MAMVDIFMNLFVKEHMREHLIRDHKHIFDFVSFF